MTNFITIANCSYRGGANISLLILLKGLKSKGYNPIVISSDDGFLIETSKELGFETHIIPFQHSIWPKYRGIRNIHRFFFETFKMMRKNLKAVKAIKKIALNYEASFIHTNVSVLNIGYYAAKSLNIPHFWHIREYGDKDFNMRNFISKKSLEKKLQKGNVVAITKELKNYFNQDNNCMVIYNPIEIINHIKLPEKENRFIYVGHITMEKGADMILEAFGRFYRKNKNYKLDFIGECPEHVRKELDSIIDVHSLKDNVNFMGLRSDIYEQMGKSKAIIVASRSEGFGRITAEAMMNYCLVIGRNTAGTKEQLDNGLNLFNKEIGLRFNDVNSLEKCLEEVATMSAEQYDEMLMNAHETVVKLYNPKNSVDKMDKFIEERLNWLL